MYAQKHQHKRNDHALIKSRADGNAHARRSPQSGRSRQSLDLLPAGNDDRAGSQKADAAVDLCAKSAHIDLPAGRFGKPQPIRIEPNVQILTQNAGQRCSKANEHIGAKACRTVLAPTLKSDHSAKYHRQQQPQQHRRKGQFSKIVQTAYQFIILL